MPAAIQETSQSPVLTMNDPTTTESVLLCNIATLGGESEPALHAFRQPHKLTPEEREERRQRLDERAHARLTKARQAAFDSIWQGSKASGADLVVLLALAQYVEGVDPHAPWYVGWPALDDLATIARTSVRGAQLALSRLERAGCIDCDHGNHGYHINDPKAALGEVR